MGKSKRSGMILPTHKCFDDVLEHQVELRGRDAEAAARQVIVHGICLAPEGPRAGEPFAHAWVEDGDLLWQAGLLEDGTKVWFSLDTTTWRTALRVQAETRYTLDEALIKNWQTATYGPWVPAYRALCGRGHELFKGED
jgi:hypothetical protein